MPSILMRTSTNHISTSTQRSTDALMHFDGRLTFRLLLTKRELNTNELFKKEFKEHFCFYRNAYFYDGGRELAVL